MEQTNLLNKKYVISYPVFFTEDEFNFLIFAYKNGLTIAWDGKSLRNKLILVKNTKISNEEKKKYYNSIVVRSLLEKRYLVSEKVTNKDVNFSEIITVNPLLEIYIKQLQNKIYEFDIELNGQKDTIHIVKDISKEKVTLVAQPYFFDIDEVNGYRNENSNVNIKEMKKLFYLTLIRKGLLNKYIFEYDNNYFIFKEGKFLKYKKKYLKSIIGLDSNNDSKNTPEEPEKEPDKEPEQEPEKEPDKEPNKEPDKEPEKEPDKEPDESHLTINDIINDVVEIDNTEITDSVTYSVSKTKFIKPISKLKLDFTEPRYETTNKLFRYYFKNIDYNKYSTVELVSKIINEFMTNDIYSFYQITGAKPVNDPEIVSSMVGRFGLNPKTIIPMILDSNKPNPSNRRYSKNFLALIDLANTKKSNSKINYYYFKSEGALPEEVLVNKFSNVIIQNISDFIGYTMLREDIENTGDKLTDIQNELLKKIYEEFSIRKTNVFKGFIKRLDKIDKYKDVWDELYTKLLYFYNKELSVEMMNSVRNSSNSYARSFEDKKNINKSTQESMKESKFLSTGIFEYVEYDNDVDLNLVDKVSNEFLEIDKYLPKLNNKLILRFRKLGNIRISKMRGVAGVYFSSFKTICVDLDNTYSFVHEFGHAFDYSFYSDDITTKSMEKSFEHILIPYTKYVLEHNVENSAYYTIPTEVFARSFEVYIQIKLKNKGITKTNLLVFNETEPQYKYLIDHQEEIIKYFDSIIK